MAAALLVAVADFVEVFVRIAFDDEAAAAEVREAYWAESVIVFVTSVVSAVPLASCVWSSVMVVKPDTGGAVARLAEGSAVTTPAVPMDD